MVQDKSERRSKFFPERQLRQATTTRHQGLREKLLAIAERVIEHQGLDQIKARDLASQVDCSVGAIYNVFADLDALILEVNAGTLRAIDSKMTAVQGSSPLAKLLGLAEAYVSYATENPLRWDALFSHRMPFEATVPEWFVDIQNAAFSHIEGPLNVLRPDLDPAANCLLGRSIFAAVHGMVALGLEKRIAPIDLSVLRSQISLVVRAIVHGLPAIKSEGGDQ